MIGQNLKKKHAVKNALNALYVKKYVYILLRFQNMKKKS